MDKKFWHRKWENNDIAFHENSTNPLLVHYFNQLSLAEGSRLFIPLCGKTLDIAWLLSKGYRVAGAELSTLAIEQLFAALELKPTLSTIGEIDHYSAKNIDIFVGDIFDLSGKLLGKVDAVYDRAALVALPEIMRTKYASHVTEITNNAPQLLICCEYNQPLMEGPPFSISTEEIHRHYKDRYDLTLLASTNIPNKLKGKWEAKECVWLLRTRQQNALM